MLVYTWPAVAQNGEETALNVLDFNGTSTYADFFNGGNLNSDERVPHSVETWFKVNSQGQTSTIIAKTNSQHNSYHFIIGLAGGKVSYVRGNYSLVGTTVVEANTWNHLSAVYDGSRMLIYLNGDLEGQIVNNHDLPLDHNDLMLGAKPVSGGQTQYFDGQLEELKLWGHVRVQEEIMSTMNQISIGVQTEPASYYQFNQYDDPATGRMDDVQLGTYLYVQNGTLLPSDCPVDANTNYQSVVINTNQNYKHTDVSLQFSTSGGHLVAVSAMDHAPSSWQGINNETEILEGRYWVVNWLPGPSLNADMEIRTTETLPFGLDFTTDKAELYRKKLNNSGTWEYYTSATSVDIPTGTLTFHITDPGQYAVRIDEAGIDVITELNGSSCNRVNTTFSNSINARPLENVDMYEFVVSNEEDGFSDSLQSETPSFKLKFLESQVRYGRTYSVQVRGIWNGQTGPLGDACTVTTIDFPTTQLEDELWDSEVTMKQKMKCNNISGVTEYIFHVSDTSSGFEQKYVSLSRDFKLKYMEGPFNYSQQYQVKVRGAMLGDTSDYGPERTIYTSARPETRLRDGYCDTTGIRKSTWLKAQTVHFVDEYEFKVENQDYGVSGTYITDQKEFKMREIEGVTNCGLSYDVSVRTIMNGDTSAWGDTCTVSTENLGCRLASLDQTDNLIHETPTPETTILGAYPNPFNHTVTLKYLNGRTQNISIEIYDATGRLIREYYPQEIGPGNHEFEWDGKNSNGNDCHNGTYIMTLRNDKDFKVRSVRLILRR